MLGPKSWLTTEEIALELRVSVRTVQRLIADGEIEGVRVGKLWRVRRNAFEKWLAQQTNQPSAPEDHYPKGPKRGRTK